MTSIIHMMDSERNVAWIVGGGSGMGRASAVALAASGWRVIVSGRRAGPLEETVELIRTAGGDAVAQPFDVIADDTHAAAERAVAQWGRLDGLVTAAGLNSPQRTWADQPFDVLEAVMQTNLVGTTRVLTAALPALRSTAGVIVVISSYSAWGYQPLAGVAYSASKTALGAIVRTLNTQGAPDGVRACHLCPGDVDTPFVDKRRAVPTAEQRAVMLSPEDIGGTVAWVMNAPKHVRVDELVISPVSQV